MQVKVLQEHFAVLSTCINLQHGFKTLVLSIIEWLIKKFTVYVTIYISKYLHWQPTSEGESVEISDTMLFDESADVFSINITSSGRLIWDPEANKTELKVSYIWIEGRLDIGSEECPYEGETTITLTGNPHTVKNKRN